MITTSTSRTAVVRPIVRIQTHSGTFIGRRLPVTVHQQVAEGLSRPDGRPAPREKTGSLARSSVLTRTPRGDTPLRVRTVSQSYGVNLPALTDGASGVVSSCHAAVTLRSGVPVGSACG